MSCQDCGTHVYYKEEYCERCKTFHTEEYMIACLIKANSCRNFKWKLGIWQVYLNRHCQNCVFYKNHSCQIQK